MWEGTRGAVTASSVEIKTVSELVVVTPVYRFTLLLLPGPERVLLWVALVGQGVWMPCRVVAHSWESMMFHGVSGTHSMSALNSLS